MEEYKRPRSVWILFLVLAGLATLALLRLFGGFKGLGYLPSLEVSVSPWFFIFTGSIGLMGFSIGAYYTYKGNPIAPKFVIIFSIVFLIFEWIDRLFISIAPNNNTNLLFWGLINLMYALLIVYVFYISNARMYFGERYAQKPKDRKTS